MRTLATHRRSKPGAGEPGLRAEIEALRVELAEAREVLRAVREGEVDALVGPGPDGRVYTLRSADHPYRVLIESMNQGAVTSKADGTILYCNARFAAMLKVPLQSLVGASLHRFLEPRDLPLLESLFARARKKSATEEVGLHAADKSEIPALLSVNLLPGQPADVFCLVVTDLTDQNIRNAELTAANRELEAFCYSISHDLRTPLRGINGFSRLLLTDHAKGLDDQAKSYLTRVRAATLRMSQLIDDLLGLSRVTRNGARFRRVDLSALARSIAAELSEKDLSRRVDVRIEPGLTAFGDEGLLRIALTNLFSNAWKFTGKHPKARIRFGVEGKGREDVYFLKDDGAGFDMAYVGNLFRAFQRLHDEADFPGTGIGLATVQRIIHRHGGRVWIKGAVEKGAVVRFTLEGKSSKRPRS